ncbi:MAG: tetratricopeptide repeat protein, partial [Phycisphaeraceae bacterium]|nr:tetratricopeptide repeat protein [Phycisphaeraceae bacterium]
MFRSRLILGTLASLVLFLLSGPRLAAQAKRPPLVPKKIQLNGAVQKAIDDELIDDAERTDLRIFHGQWDDLDKKTRASARMALARWDLNHPSLQNEKTPLLLRARAAYRAGRLSKTIELLQNEKTLAATVLRGKALAGSGKYPSAIETLDPIRKNLQGDGYKSAPDITAAAEAMVLLAELEGRPADDYRFIMSALGRVHQRIDPFHWPAMVAEGRLLMDKANPAKAVEALHESLSLNPRCSEAFYELGQIAVSFYNFDQAEAAIARLRQIHPRHILAEVLEIELLLTQKDPLGAQKKLDESLKRYPTHRRLLALGAAVAAQRHDRPAMRRALEAFEQATGKHPLGLYLAGIYMSKDRQYETAEKLLRAAIARQPNWPNPRVELGWVLHQAGKEKQSLEALRDATQLDPFNQRAGNSLVMLEALVQYHRVETEHFIIKYSHKLKHEVDRVLAADMADQLDRMFEEVTATFDYKPRAKTLLEIMPNKEWFAVRITGMPDIWTIGACTGPVIAIAPPRIGKRQAGAYDWYRVIRHEFTHTVTLEMTGNRIPHWFTEACAVSQEPGPRDYATCKLLAEALAEDELFDLENLTWGFVRPEKPTDRSLAYAQSHW